MSIAWNKSILKNKEYFFWIAYILYLTELLFYSSMFGEMDSLHLIFKLSRNISYLLICLKIILDLYYREYTWKENIIVFLLTIFILSITKMTLNKNILIYWCFILGAKNIELQKIIKVAIVIHICCMLTIIAGSIHGIIEDRIYIQRGDRSRSSLGYQYTTDSSNYFFHIILMYIYSKREKISWGSLGILALCNLLLYRLTDTRSAYLIGSMVLIIAALWKQFHVLRKNNILYKIAVIGCVPLLSITIMYLSFYYNKNLVWMEQLNNKINGRLELGYNAFKEYGIHLFGRPIEWVGGSSLYTGGMDQYNYVDSSYVQIILNFGILFFVLICIGFMILGWKVAKKNDVYFSLILIAIALHSILDPQLIWMAYNPFIMCYMYIRYKDKLVF